MRYIVIFLLISVMGGCQSRIPSGPASATVDHQVWTSLLQKYVDENGAVDYQAFRKDTARLNHYLQVLQNNIAASSWPDEAQLAYWINLYNAFTIKLVLDHFPVKSIKDIGPTLQVPFINSVFDIKFISLNGKKYDLNFIEHRILRKKFQEPRIHFAINCASVSCPALRQEAYTASALEEQLDQQARRFIYDSLKNQWKGGQVKLSKIFSWFKGDFTQDQSLVQFLNQYIHPPIPSSVEIDYLDYNWSINSPENMK